jgi:hypothetical protein
MQPLRSSCLGSTKWQVISSFATGMPRAFTFAMAAIFASRRGFERLLSDPSGMT